MALSRFSRRKLLVEAGQIELVFVLQREGDKIVHGRLSRLCVICGEWKPIREFPRNGVWSRYDCKACHGKREQVRKKATRVVMDEMDVVRTAAEAMSAWNALTRRRTRVE